MERTAATPLAERILVLDVLRGFALFGVLLMNIPAMGLPEAAAYFNQMIGKTYPDEVYRPFMGVNLKYLDRAYSAIHAKAGSVEAYLVDVLQVDAALQADLRAKLIEA
jgi:predicted acyltransferase